MKKKTEYMRCTADLNSTALLIPGAALKISNFDGQTQAEYRPLDQVIVVLKKRMTAPELLSAVQQLSETAADLMVQLTKVCGPCEDCAGGCPCGSEDDSPLRRMPMEMLLTFAKAGVCLGELEEHLILEDIIYSK